MDELITTKQVQDLLQVDRITVYRMLKDGRLNGVKVGKQWRFHQNEIENLFSNGTGFKTDHQPEFSPNEVLPVHCIQVIQDVFAEMNEIGVITTDSEGIPITEISNSCEFCSLVLNSDRGKQACIESWKKLADDPGDTPQFFQCHAGFQFARSRIELHGKLTAILIGGQFLRSHPMENELSEKVAEIAGKYQIPPALLSRAAESIPVFDEEKQNRIGKWLGKVGETFQIIGHERAELLGRLKNIADMSTFKI